RANGSSAAQAEEASPVPALASISVRSASRKARSRPSSSGLAPLHSPLVRHHSSRRSGPTSGSRWRSKLTLLMKVWTGSSPAGAGWDSSLMAASYHHQTLLTSYRHHLTIITGYLPSERLPL